MRVNKNDDSQECFVGQQTQVVQTDMMEEIKVCIIKKFHQQLPANQLRTARRPEHMAPRTFFLQRPFHLLKPPLNQPCIQWTLPSDPNKLRIKIVNKDNLSIEQYFNKKKFKCLYNRLDNYNNDYKSFQGRLKGIDNLIDYNWKAFKQLQKQQKKSPLEQQRDLIDGDFESGNVCRAYMNPQQQKQYYLLIENDLNTYGYNNWFFFRLRNTDKGIRRFTIANLIKKTSFFNQGMMISIFSMNKHKYQGYKWFKGGERITFGSINLTRTHHLHQHYHSLSFQYDFQYEEDQVYFALNQPYTYSRLITFIQTTKKVPKEIKMDVKTVGYSVSNNILPSIRLSLTQPKNKEVILILARQHPCETVGSFIAEQIINYLLQKNQITSFLFQTFDFHIIPMVNPDGVIHGSSRCNMAGLDLNRQWGEYILKQLTPQTVKVKQYIMNLAKTQKIKYMIDLHGHGKKLNSFFFSCKDSEKEDVQVLSTMMKKMESRFNFQDCTYGITQDKENTIRSTINSMGISHSYTLETSLYGWKNQQNQIKHFSQEDYKQIGKSLIKSLFLIEASPALTMSELGFTKDGILKQMANTLLDKYNRGEVQHFDDNDILSDSDPEGDKLDIKDLLGKCQNKALQKKIQAQYKTGKKQQQKLQEKTKDNNLQHKRSQSNKQIRQTCPSSLSIKGKLSATNQSFYVKEAKYIKEKIGKSDAKDTSRKTPFCEKWKERRKQIEKKRVLQQKQFGHKDLEQKMLQRTYTRLDRTKRKSQRKAVLPFRANIPTSALLVKNQMAKVRHSKRKMKTQFRQVEMYLAPSQEELTSHEARKSALQLKFKDLKKQSLNALLTDTLSILKINPGEKQKSNYENKESKRCSVKMQKQQVSTQPALHSSQKVTTSMISNPERESIKLKKFRQFQHGLHTKRRQSQLSSVFYYFPIF